MTFPAARVTDMHVCPEVIKGAPPVPHVGGPIVKPNPQVLIGYLPAATATATAVCVGPPDTITKGSATVLCGNLPQARVMDSCAHGGMVVLGSFTSLCS